MTSTLGSRSTFACSETVIVESAPTTFELERTALKTSAAAADTGKHTAESSCAGGGTASADEVEEDINTSPSSGQQWHAE